MSPIHRPARTRKYEATFLPGLRYALADEIRSTLPRATEPIPVPGRNDALAFAYPGPTTDLRRLRTAVAAFLVLRFGIAKPASLLRRENLRRIADAAEALARQCHDDPPRSFRIEAAGSDSAVFRRIAEDLASATGLPYRRHNGDLVVRVRRSPDADGWDVLVRTTTRPLSARRWRVADYPGAANATIAAAIAQTVPDRPRVLNLMCGSGTLLIERLLHSGTRESVGVDHDEAAILACKANLNAANLTGRAQLLTADITEPGLLKGRKFDAILADPPWGTITGSHATNGALYEHLLTAARNLAAPQARLTVLTHEIRLMERLLPRFRSDWRVEEVHKVFQKGHHPRIYVLGAIGPKTK
ncbi:TRM11 family SAM-dependent methyltransferase [Glycomyces paridis]|uniref:RNA methyltransferase n=1 Tax=Glycomyces paridis TaxID=2126555 RepID=A0A4S8PDR5_9ACTN|nr:methyltransferase [Glycomyces paridis]THV26429.1 RNA methyltransferase [Glycomyces paridis]